MLKTFDALRTSAAKNGGVRVIVSVAPEGQGSLPETETAKRQLITRMRPEASTLESIEGTPFVVMELTAQGVERLAADPAVKNVQQDSPERSQ